MYRSRRIILLSHCILNYNSKIENSTVCADTCKETVRLLLQENIGILQLPCPEASLFGMKRWGHVREQFDTPFFRRHCRSIFTPYLEQLLDYHKNGYDILGLVGINGSPSCGVTLTCSGNWGGEFPDPASLPGIISPAKLISSKGIFIEEIESMLASCSLPLPAAGIDECDRAFSIEQINKLLRRKI